MTYLVRLQPRAERDLDSLFRYIRATDSLAAASRFNGIADAILSLKHLPSRCPTVSGHPGIRHLLYGNRPHIYRIIFRIDRSAHAVDVVHIRHDARRSASRL